MNKDIKNNDKSMAKTKLKGKLYYLVAWIIIIFVLWFAKSEKNIWHIFQELFCKLIYATPDYEYGFGETDEYTAYAEADLYENAALWEEQVYVYCVDAETGQNQTAKEDRLDTAQENNKDVIENEARAEEAEEKGKEEKTDISKEQEKYIAAMASFTSYKQNILSDFDLLKSSYYVVDGSTSVLPEELDGVNLAGMDLTIDTESKDYKILIYHTHSTESFEDSRPGERADTVVGMGDYLAELLSEQYGVKVYHDDTAYDIVNGTLDRSAAYDYARTSVAEILKEHPSIEVVIDLHRDGVADDTHLVTEIDGKPTAQIMFLNGMSRLSQNGDIEYLPNSHKIENLAFSLQLYLTAAANYEGLMRRIYIRGYRYNLDLADRCLLVEVGGQTNTVEEAKNSMEPLAAILYKVLSGK